MDTQPKEQDTTQAAAKEPHQLIELSADEGTQAGTRGLCSCGATFFTSLPFSPSVILRYHKEHQKAMTAELEPTLVAGFEAGNAELMEPRKVEQAPYTPQALDLVALYRSYAERVEERWLGHRVSVALDGEHVVGILVTADCDTLKLLTPRETMVPTPRVLSIRHGVRFGDAWACPACAAEAEAREQTEEGRDSC